MHAELQSAHTSVGRPVSQPFHPFGTETHLVAPHGDHAPPHVVQQRAPGEGREEEDGVRHVAHVQRGYARPGLVCAPVLVAGEEVDDAPVEVGERQVRGARAGQGGGEGGEGEVFVRVGREGDVG